MPTKNTGGQENNEPNRRPRDQQKQDATAAAVVALKEALVEQSDTNREEEGRQNLAEKIIEIATLFFVVATTGGVFLQAYILHESDRAIQISAVAAKDAADATRKAVELSDKTAERQLRAYLYVSHGPWKQYPPQTPGSGPQYGTEIIINHAGVTPAYKVRIDATIEIGRYLLNETKLDSAEVIGGGGVTRREYPILYGTEPIRQTTARPFDADALRLTTSKDPLIGDHRFYVHGVIRYRDIFGLENPGMPDRRYEFCFIFHPEREPEGTEKGCEQYNKPG